MLTYRFSVILYLLFAATISSPGQSLPLNPSLDVKIGQMLMAGFRGTEITGQSSITKDLTTYHLGGVVLFDYDVPGDTTVRNVISSYQVYQLTKDLQTYASIPLFIAIDQEGGKIVRLKPRHGFLKTVSAQYLGEINHTDSTRKYARETALLLHKLGINTNLAPVTDLNSNPDNPVIGGLERSFSSNAEIVTKQAKIYINTLHNHGIITTLKHFPGHGSSEDDSHLGVVDVTDTWHKKELIPYRRLIKAGFADIVMTAHIFNAKLDAAYPATLSEPVITNLLRDSLGFGGVVMSDDLQMKAIRTQYGLKETIKLSLQAGVDILVFANNSIFDPEIVAKAHRIITELVDEGAVSKKRIDKSYRRIMELKKKYLAEQKR